jgi:hypothetical protein
MAKQHLSLKQVERALRAAHGNVTKAALVLGITSQGVRYRIGRTPRLQALQAELVEEELDLHEDKLRSLGFDADNVTALLAFLNAYGKARGYGRQTVTAQLEHEHRHQHTHEHHVLIEQMQNELLDRINRHVLARSEPAMIGNGRNGANGSDN